MDTENTATRSRGRPRSEATHQAILDAAVELLNEGDYASVTMDGIAERAKVSKQTIYRWWESKADVILEAYSDRVLSRVAAPVPSGDAIADLQDLLKRFFAATRDPLVEKGVRSLIAEAQFDRSFQARLYAEFIMKRREVLLRVLQSGVTTGQFKADANLEFALDMILGGYWYRLLSGTEAELDDKFAADIAAMLRPVLTTA